MVRHQHVLIANLPIGRERARHVHVTLIGKGFHKVKPATPDVAKVHIEQLATLSKPADHIKDLAARVIEHRRDGALAEVEAVIGALVHHHKALEPIDGAEHARHPAPSGRRIWIVRMAGEPHPSRGRYRYDRGKETVDALPVLLLGDRTSRGR